MAQVDLWLIRDRKGNAGNKGNRKGEREGAEDGPLKCFGQIQCLSYRCI